MGEDNKKIVVSIDSTVEKVHTEIGDGPFKMGMVEIANGCIKADCALYITNIFERNRQYGIDIWERKGSGKQRQLITPKTFYPPEYTLRKILGDYCACRHYK